MKLRIWAALGSTLVALSTVITSGAVIPDPFGCDLPVPDAYLVTSNPLTYQPFLKRDGENQACATQRSRDQMNPAYEEKMRSVGPPAYQRGVSAQASETSRPRLTAAQWLPGASVADPFRTTEEWQGSGRGRSLPVSFIATRTGARLAGTIFLPPLSVPGPYPGVVIATGSTQQFRQQYNWAAQGLAEEGYQVLTFDFQGQGGSENLDHNPDGSFCLTGSCLQDIPPPEETWAYARFYDQVRDSIRFFFSTPSQPYSSPNANSAGTDPYNPAYGSLDPSKVGLAGHSVGAIAINDIGQEDQRIRAIVRWGFTGFVSEQYKSKVHAPTLIMSSDYGSRGPEPFLTIAPPGVPELGYQQLRSLSPAVDVMLISLRASTHNEWAYISLRPASRYGERVSFHYTLAWFDAYLKGLTDNTKRASAFTRLTASTFDQSADLHSIGAGTWEPPATNVPYRIQGQRVCTRISYIYKSAYWLQGGGLTDPDLRTGCGYRL